MDPRLRRLSPGLPPAADSMWRPLGSTPVCQLCWWLSGGLRRGFASCEAGAQGFESSDWLQLHIRFQCDPAGGGRVRELRRELPSCGAAPRSTTSQEGR